MKTLGEILTGREIVALPPTATVHAAAEAMAENRVGAVLVCDDEGRPLGIFSERDLAVRVVVPGLDPTKALLSQVMTTELFTAGPSERISAVTAEMQRRHIRHLPVVEDGRVLGLLSQRDLLRHHLAAATGEVEALTAYIQGPDTTPPAEQVE